MISKLMEKVKGKKKDGRDNLAIIIVDLCFVTSYKIEELLTMPSSRLDMLIERFRFHYEEKGVKK